MNPTKRVLSIDVMRGLTLFLMLFVNDLYVPGVPDWLRPMMRSSIHKLEIQLIFVYSTLSRNVSLFLFS